ncbi:GNAT family N-acetyltransferase [Butyrivibrio sp. VCD2006]|uniref:GNAT family N-acetyltransferase n=1 Tax=Butyrivibrio sp. VCD2006 TaxID=1280664 RepID=UPI000560D524|nr:GNAT family N-acetyltransferase [Butyrivibrio sp. VCD2006]
MFELRQIGLKEKEPIKALFQSVFMSDPWNDDWSDEQQLDLYIIDLIGQSNSLTYGLYEGDDLIGISLGFTKHWFSGTEYIIDEFCIKMEKQGTGAGSFFMAEIEKAIKEKGLIHIFLQTDSEVPAYSFYKKNGFVELKTHVSFSKDLKNT